MIEIVPHQSDWAKQYQRESNRIKKALGENLVDIYHIGSTSVKGLASKEKIDIIAEVRSGKSSILPLEKIGFSYKGEWNIPFKYAFTLRDYIKINLHVLEENHPEIESNILFRDYLRNNDEVKNAYEDLKYKIIKDPASHERNPQRFYNYTIEKSDFIFDILKKSGFDRLRMIRCTTPKEWLAAKKFRANYFQHNEIKTQEIDYNDKNQDHFILYKGVEIVGYANSYLNHTRPSDNIAPPILLITDEKYREQNLDAFFMKLIKKWLQTERTNIVDL